MDFLALAKRAGCSSSRWTRPSRTAPSTRGSRAARRSGTRSSRWRSSSRARHPRRDRLRPRHRRAARGRRRGERAAQPGSGDDRGHALPAAPRLHQPGPRPRDGGGADRDERRPGAGARAREEGLRLDREGAAASRAGARRHDRERSGAGLREQLTRAALAGRAGLPGGAARRRARDLPAGASSPPLQHEDWRYTNLAPLAAQAFGRRRGRRRRRRGERCRPRRGSSSSNGRLDAAASDLAGSPTGVRAGQPRRGAPRASRRGRAAPRPARATDPASRLRRAQRGAVRGRRVRRGGRAAWSCAPTIHLVFASAGGAASVASHPRNLSSWPATARAHRRGELPRRGDGYLVNAVTEVVLGEGAELEHDRLQEDAPEAFHIGLLQVAQGAAEPLPRAVDRARGQARPASRRGCSSAQRAPRATSHGLYVAGGAAGRSITSSASITRARAARAASCSRASSTARSRGVFAGRITVAGGRAEDRRRPGELEPAPLRGRHRRHEAAAGDPRRRREVLARRLGGPAPRGRAVLPAVPRHRRGARPGRCSPGPSRARW